ncbi:MAG: VWA domain-containing protein [Planctomycetales bacterium]|nr:VWA domain-containing protein [Planctomycetales bacterium]
MKRHHPTRQGTIIVLSAFMLAMLSIIAALCMNSAYVALAKTEMRLATDAAAKAASITYGITGSMDAARLRGRQICQRHSVAGAPLQIRNIDVTFGSATPKENGRYEFTPDGTPTNSTQVHASFVRRAGGVSALPALGQFLDREDFQLEETSIATRVDNDICLVVDRSCSMAWDLSNDPYSYPGELNGRSIIQNYFLNPHATLSRWAALQSSVDTFLTVLNTNPYHPRVSLVSYASNFEFGLFRSTVSSIDQPLTINFDDVRSKLATLATRPLIGNTNIAAGLRDGIATLTEQGGSRPNATHNLILLTDGIMTQGDDPVALAALALSQNIKVHTITFSSQADQVLMQQVATAGGGSYYHAPDAATLHAIFQQLAETLPAMLVQ